MKLCKLTILRLKSYFRNPGLTLSFAGFFLALWAVLTFTPVYQNNILVLPIGIIDLDQSDYSKLISKRMAEKESVQVMPLSREKALKEVRTGKLEAIYILKKGLMDNILQGDVEEIIEIIKSPVSLSAGIIGELFASEVIRLSSNVDAATSVLKDYGRPGNKDTLWDEAWNLTDGYWDPAPLVQIDYSLIGKDEAYPHDISLEAQVRNKITKFLALALLIFSILAATTSLWKEKTNGILKRVISTGTPLWLYLVSSILSILVIHGVGLLLIISLVKWRR